MVEGVRHEPSLLTLSCTTSALPTPTTLIVYYTSTLYLLDIMKMLEIWYISKLDRMIHYIIVKYSIVKLVVY